MEGWTLLSSDRQVVPHERRAETELLHADLRHVDAAIPELYWQAPRSYLGDRVSRGIGSGDGDSRVAVFSGGLGGGAVLSKHVPLCEGH